LTKNGLGHNLGDFFTNSSGHPAIYPKCPQNIPTGREIYQIAIKQNSILHSMALGNIPNVELLE
jgi:hypothetical protein